MPFAQFEYAVKSTLGREACFDFMPEADISAARAAMNGGVAQNILWDAEINCMAFQTFQLAVELLCHGPASRLSQEFRKDIIFVASFKRALLDSSQID